MPGSLIKGHGALACPGCAVILPAEAGPTHPYLGSSPACWARFGELCALGYENPAYRRLHQLAVDAYAVQHPGKPERRTIQSVAVHLMTLGMILEDGIDPRAGPELHKRMVRGDFVWLDPPPMEDRMKVTDVLAAKTSEEHLRLVGSWAHDVWAAWRPHHATVRRWLHQILEDSG